MPLYLRFYLAILGSVVLAAALGAGLWHLFGPEGGPRRGSDMLVRLAERALPPADSPASAQQAALDRLARDLPGSVALYGADGKLIASIGRAPARTERWTYSSTLDDGRVLVARGPHPVRHRTPGFWAIVVLLLALGAAYLVARRLTRRLERLQAAVESLGTGDLAARVPVEGKDEVARLARSFNQAAGRIESLVGANRALLANASHELRTPLARIRMALATSKTEEINRNIAELDELIDEILLASRLEAPQPLALEDIDLLGLCAEEGARYDDVQVEGTSATVRGEPRLLRRLVRNLLENARRHGRPPVRVSVARGPEHLELRVRDAGEAVPLHERERIFEPFYRRAGSAYAGGAGLGLAIVRQIARRHGGEARYDDAGFVVTLKREIG